MVAKSITVAGDLNSLGGVVSPSISNKKIYINNIPISVTGDTVSPHGTPPLPGNTIGLLNTKVFIDNIPVIVAGDSDTPYGAKRLPSVTNLTVFIL